MIVKFNPEIQNIILKPLFNQFLWISLKDLALSNLVNPVFVFRSLCSGSKIPQACEAK